LNHVFISLPLVDRPRFFLRRCSLSGFDSREYDLTSSLPLFSVFLITGAARKYASNSGHHTSLKHDLQFNEDLTHHYRARTAEEGKDYTYLMIGAAGVTGFEVGKVRYRCHTAHLLALALSLRYFRSKRICLYFTCIFQIYQPLSGIKYTFQHCYYNSPIFHFLTLKLLSRVSLFLLSPPCLLLLMFSPSPTSRLTSALFLREPVWFSSGVESPCSFVTVPPLISRPLRVSIWASSVILSLTLLVSAGSYCVLFRSTN
jgi:hypothetical protein